MGNQNGWYSHNVRFLNFELTMKPFNLEEYYKNPSRKVVTGDGRSVKIHCTNYHPPQPVIAEVEGSDYATSFSSDGKYYRNRDSMYDLFFAPEKHEGWINVYSYPDNNIYAGTRVYNSKEVAEEIGKDQPGYLTTVKIEWEE